MDGEQRQLSLSDKLDSLIHSHNGPSNSLISESVGCTVETVPQIVSQRSRITKCSSPRFARRYLELGYKLKVIFLAESGTPRQEILGEFSISPRTIRQRIHKKDILQSHAKNGRLRKIKKELYAKIPEVDAELEGFIDFARSLSLPVTLEIMQERAMTSKVFQISKPVTDISKTL